MPRVKFDYVVSFSSEDAESPASNLLASEVSSRRWLCGDGAASCSAVVQLARAVRVSGVTVGAHHTALVEVLVGRSETPDDPYKVLVPSCVFLSPMESRKGEGVERVRSFSGDQLAADVRDNKWDRVRVVCSQPYNKHCKYGLSFLHIFEPEEQNNRPVATPPPTISVPPQLFTLDDKSSDEEDSFKPGELFAKHFQNKASTTSTEVQIRQASTQAIKKISESATKLVKTPISKEKTKVSTSSSNEDTSKLRERNNLMYTDDDNKPHGKIDKVVQRHNDEKRKKEDESSNKIIKTCDDEDKQQTYSNDKMLNLDRNNRKQKHSDVDRNSSSDRSSTSRTKDSESRSKEKNDDRRTDRKRTESSQVSKRDRNRDVSTDRQSKKRRHSDEDSNSSGKKARLVAGPVSSSPHELLAGVVFVLSGYQNPRRAALRDLALALGATYSRDWAPHCTHLICAFPKTPKLQAVRSGAGGESAVVVRGEWLEEVSARRRLLPWQWFATEPRRCVARPPDDRLSGGEDGDQGRGAVLDSECDTDDEIEKVLQKQKKDREPRVPNKEDTRNTHTVPPSGETSRDSGDSTEEEEEAVAGGARGGGGRDTLPDFLEGHTFLIEEGVRGAGFDTELLARYVRAYGGELLEQWSQLDEDSEVSYVLCGAGRGGGAAR